MKKTSLYLLFSSLLAIALAGVQPATAADNKPKPPEATPGAPATAKPKRDWYPFSGTVGAVDQQAKTVSLKKKEGERILKLDSKSELEVNGKPGTLADVKVGSYAHGKLHKDASLAEVITAAKFDKERAARSGVAPGKDAVEKRIESRTPVAPDQPIKKTPPKTTPPQQ